MQAQYYYCIMEYHTDLGLEIIPFSDSKANFGDWPLHSINRIHKDWASLVPLQGFANCKSENESQNVWPLKMFFVGKLGPKFGHPY